ncbi:hypothetical protein TP70_01950 [Staphylococcus microti]|uniref:Type II secretion system protein n=1 Tax=Staphylococcus microti TaxID=569857 RepID=A0ABR5CA22_9STAP|nr:prepilin-type N-terminal cleavage/methylation domain-containing protein [Staphylococcus microti]KIX91577.1 hypothetical protein TP70_01950 [Staphylococcus microti]
MNQNGYTLIEALFAFFIVSLLSFSTLPILHQLEVTYDNMKEDLALQRTLYFYLKENKLEGRIQLDQFVINRTTENVCITNVQSNKNYCHQLKRLHND